METSKLDSTPPATAPGGGTVDWSRSLTRTIAVLTGITALLAGAVVLGFAVFGEPGGDDSSATWLAVSLVVEYLLIGVAVSVTVANPGKPALISAAVLAGVSLIAVVVTIATMPGTGHGDWISHRQALGALSFALTALGGGLLVLAEWVIREGVGAAPPRGLIVRSGVLGVVFVIVLAAAGTAAAHDLVEAANTDESTAAPEKGLTAAVTPATFEHMNPPYPGGGDAIGTPYGLLVTAPETLAVTAYDADSGTERWHHVRHNRTFTQRSVTSADERLIALVGDRRDSPAGTSVVILDTVSGEQFADRRVSTSDGTVLAVTSQLVLFQPAERLGTVIAYGYSGRELWSYDAPERCVVGVAREAGTRMVTAMDCAADDISADHPRVVALDEQNGAAAWSWTGPVIGGIAPGSLVVSGDKVVVDVRRDVSSSEGLFAARLFRHDLNALNAADGSTVWRREKLELGSTYAVSCAGTLQIGDGLAVLGECHHATMGGQATFDIATYDLADGKTVWKAGAPLGFTPGDGSDPAGWFVTFPDGRVAMVTDASNDVTAPACGLYLAAAGKVKRIQASKPATGGIEEPTWCRKASLHATPGALSVSYPGQVFSIR
ncbi:outer membrane protein assembly factor BamB family protein [Phytomonospora endophytica]|uniref:Outer membrane protein assembly factor BamB n=1 Tax=Phytomonospora endophytica TaxID=714109 RepID=A0A841FNN5_9ACTN|nr:PQQ-binding-like beta-propeller repeat protein [Phytomonospora endophytica]MBB6037454.1 outer membrane protein assembly factor BamB [Phytomonospora endophytica]GIG70704.1 hypothetical protein Pen01_69990 [Phytomonospora endophytica]